ncbi:MAG: GTPase HflX [Victivallaceae bacterium]|nr:GTPase HflX [Victivallaceae bacterium]MDD4317716.1 GTPase HflX [Victivallaceae bacterium]MDD5662701.1 GTPase HflX [Victivallaceae bacterium]NLK83586.1 GTPase HflX [Lentisphaerota bacterium]
MIETAKDDNKTVERALLVGITDGKDFAADTLLHLDELEELAGNLGIVTVGKDIVRRKVPHPKYGIGTGKTEEIAEKLKELDADCLIFDDELFPVQQRNWERLTKVPVIDRQEIILDIFAERATTKEAALQVELARLEYYLPRLTKAWSHLSRQRGGRNKGEGEKQVELDRRIVRTRIAKLKSEIEEIKSQRDTQRKSRKRNNIPMAAIVGYTNAGKSSLLNKLCHSEVYTADKLFATLDPTTKKYILPNNQELLLTDTVGFVRKLPHSLVEAFKSTLEEAIMADFLILLLDISSQCVEEQWETTLSVLKELGADEKIILPVFNKIDISEHDPIMMTRIRNLFPEAVFISASTGEGLDILCQRLENFCSEWSSIIRVKLPPDRHDLAAFSHRSGKVLESEYDEQGNLLMTIRIAPQGARRFSDYLQTVTP